MSEVLTPSRSRTITVAGGTLFRVALEQYGDALLWARIAQANGMTDPWISGIVTLVVPPRDDGVPVGGILAAV